MARIAFFCNLARFSMYIRSVLPHHGKIIITNSIKSENKETKIEHTSYKNQINQFQQPMSTTEEQSQFEQQQLCLITTQMTVLEMDT